MPGVATNAADELFVGNTAPGGATNTIPFAVNGARTSANNWKALAPAIDPHFYPLEIVLNLSKSLPSDDVRITSYNQSARQISLGGEANSPALAFQFAEKVKSNPDLRTFQFEMGTPQITPNGHAQFRLEGKPR